MFFGAAGSEQIGKERGCDDGGLLFGLEVLGVPADVGDPGVFDVFDEARLVFGASQHQTCHWHERRGDVECVGEVGRQHYMTVLAARVRCAQFGELILVVEGDDASELHNVGGAWSEVVVVAEYVLSFGVVIEEFVDDMWIGGCNGFGFDLGHCALYFGFGSFSRSSVGVVTPYDPHGPAGLGVGVRFDSGSDDDEGDGS